MHVLHTWMRERDLGVSLKSSQKSTRSKDQTDKLVRRNWEFEIGNLKFSIVFWPFLPTVLGNCVNCVDFFFKTFPHLSLSHTHKHMMMIISSPSSSRHRTRPEELPPLFIPLLLTPHEHEADGENLLCLRVGRDVAEAHRGQPRDGEIHRRDVARLGGTGANNGGADSARERDGEEEGGAEGGAERGGAGRGAGTLHDVPAQPTTK